MIFINMFNAIYNGYNKNVFNNISIIKKDNCLYIIYTSGRYNKTKSVIRQALRFARFRKRCRSRIGGGLCFGYSKRDFEL